MAIPTQHLDVRQRVRLAPRCDRPHVVDFQIDRRRTPPAAPVIAIESCPPDSRPRAPGEPAARTTRRHAGAPSAAARRLAAAPHASTIAARQIVAVRVVRVALDHPDVAGVVVLYRRFGEREPEDAPTLRHDAQLAVERLPSSRHDVGRRSQTSGSRGRSLGSVRRPHRAPPAAGTDRRR